MHCKKNKKYKKIPKKSPIYEYDHRRREKRRVRRCMSASCNKACDLQRCVVRRSHEVSQTQVSEIFGVGKKILMSVGGACDRRKRLALKYFCRRSRMRFRCLVHKRV